AKALKADRIQPEQRGRDTHGLTQGSHILSGFRELSLLHALSHVPVDEGPLGIHQVKLVVKASPSLSDGSGVAQHAHGPLDLGQISSRHCSGWLVVDAHLEASGTPVYKLNTPLGLDRCNGHIDIFGNHISTVQQAAGHVLAMARITLDHLIGWLKAGIGNVSHRQLLVVGLLSRDHWGIGGQGEVDTGVRHQVGLELRQVHIQGSIEAHLEFTHDTSPLWSTQPQPTPAHPKAPL
ncbi:hypothetical protein Z043_110433, partial [Scleropages formosus]